MTRAPLPPAIASADLEWRAGVPESKTFGDVYFNRDDGLAESRYVFLEPNDLADRFVRVPPGGSLVVAESGFGTGLNFLATWQLWKERGPEHPATLHFVSVERFPLTREDLARAVELWPELAPLATDLVDQYPPLIRGVHRLLFDGGRVRLTLYFGDVMEAWQALRFHADAWFLDGFAPSANPEMWTDESIAQIRAHSKPGTTVATFTAAERIRRALADNGFVIKKAPGFGKKRDMLTGNLPSSTTAVPEPAPGSVAIIGAGIAGCLLAHNLATRGIAVTLLDASDGPGAGASGNRQGATYVKLGVEFNDQTELALASLLFSQRRYAPYRDLCWHPCGLLQLAWSEQEQDRQRRFLARNEYPTEVFYAVDRDQASQLTGVSNQTGGLWFPGSGWLEPARLCAELSEHPLITRRYQFDVTNLVTDQDRWTVSSGAGDICVADRVVVCAGHLTPDLLPVRGEFRFKSIRGQVSHLEEQTLRNPKAVICGSRYLNPVNDGVAVTGATFDLRDMNPEPTAASHQQNLTELTSMLPGILKTPTDSVAAMKGRVAFRCTTHDYQPVAGELYDAEGNVVPGMYLLTGLGSKGLTYTPLLAEYLADQLSDQPQCLPARLARRVDSRRMHKTDNMKP